MNNKVQIYFNTDEVRVIAMGIGHIIEDFKEDQTIPWNPEARKIRKEITAACRSVAQKLERFANVKCDLPAYNPGDEDEFLTSNPWHLH